MPRSQRKTTPTAPDRDSSMLLMLSMAALAAVTALWLTRPLWRAGATPGVARRTANVLAYQSRLAELKADVSAKVLPEDEAAALQREMEARLLSDAEAADDGAASAGGPRRIALAAAFAGVILLFAGAWYWQAGSWQVAQQIAASPAAGGGDVDVEGMVAKLAQRLEASPDDAEGWAMLGRSTFVLGRHAEAASAYGKANQLAGASNAEWLVNEGESLALSRERDLLGRPAQLFDAALALTPDYGKALWYGALADAQAGNSTRAAQRLQSLLSQDLPPELQTLVLARLDELKGLSAAPAAVASVPAPAPAATSGTTLQVQVSLGPALAGKEPANATLFVFAKAAKGPPMPLAVQKLPAARLPITVTLDDSMAMTPAMNLTSFERYIVTARLSVAGTALPASGDLEGSVEVSRGAAGAVTVVIDRVVP